MQGFMRSAYDNIISNENSWNIKEEVITDVVGAWYQKRKDTINVTTIIVLDAKKAREETEVYIRNKRRKFVGIQVQAEYPLDCAEGYRPFFASVVVSAQKLPNAGDLEELLKPTDGILYHLERKIS